MALIKNDFVRSEVQQQVMSSLQKGLANPIKSINAFINNIGKDPAAEANGPQTDNAYARQNVLACLQSRKDPLLTVDWIGMVMTKSTLPLPDLPWYYIDEIQTPSVRINAEPVFREGRTKKYASSFDVDSCTLKLYTDASGQAFNFANAWVQSTKRPDGLWNLPTNYKKDIVIYVLDSTRSTVVDIRLIGCFPTSWSSYNLESGGSNPVETTLELSVDDMVINVSGEKSAAKSRLIAEYSPVTRYIEMAKGFAKDKVNTKLGHMPAQITNMLKF